MHPPMIIDATEASPGGAEVFRAPLVGHEDEAPRPARRGQHKCALRPKRLRNLHLRATQAWVAQAGPVTQNTPVVADLGYQSHASCCFVNQRLHFPIVHTAVHCR